MGVGLCALRRGADNLRIGLPAVSYHASDADKIAARFPIPAADKDRANAELASEVSNRIQMTIYSVLGTAAAVWLLTAVIGWIVRGFLGVQRGADFQQETRQ